MILRVERRRAAIDRLVPESLVLEQLATGFTWTEGPVWLPSGEVVFADIPSNSIRSWRPERGTADVFMQPSGYLGDAPFAGPEPGSNGMTLDGVGRLTVAGHGRRNVWRLETTSHTMGGAIDSNAPITVLADRFEGKRLNSPNDLVYRSDGSLYFTDPIYGLQTQRDDDPEKELAVNGVYRLAGASAHEPDAPPANERLQLLVTELGRPNGLAFSPDERFLYVNNSEPQMFWMRYAVQADGALTDGKRVCDAGIYAQRGAPDGMKVDCEGNLYSAGPGGIWVLSAEGEHLGTIQMPENVGNLTWGGAAWKTLYVTASSSLYRMEMKVAGNRPRLA